MNERKKYIKLWAVAAALSSILLLSGCIRFGPQADEMENTANSTAMKQTDTDSTSSESADNSSQSTKSTNTDEDTSSDTSSDVADSADTATDSDSMVEIEVKPEESEKVVEFQLLQLPSGYSLYKMTWEPQALETSLDNEESSEENNTEESAQELSSQGSASSSTLDSDLIATTYSQAITAGQLESNGFFIDNNGQRIGYRYTDEQTGRDGIVHLDFRDPEGSIVSWEKELTLGVNSVQNEVDNPENNQ
ncbi:hypothetical protein [Saccharibacillus sp. JS10]|uniref:hypothetical protein n=1 Tax=Saccharibacillus sp. JS10 TaxID=2950552 RepID=UPI00210D9E92|nr:hypothetical protein [Saccharibacillus sp. JS10]MCQ4085290.1 hypothetical protein [Saccharibacillus sp. JS10]